MDASHHVFGVEGDIWFPNTVSGKQTFTTAAVGSATYSYSETVQFSGTLRARLGYAADNWLFYLTGGFAWSFDQLAARKSRASPLQAMWQQGPGKVSLWSPDTGAVGAGADFALNDKWSGRIEYLFIDCANRDVAFPEAEQHLTLLWPCKQSGSGLTTSSERQLSTIMFLQYRGARARSVRISRSNDVHRTIRRAVSVTLYRPAEPLAQSGP